MSFSDWQGNEHLIARLKQMIRSGRIFHGCLFEGSPQQTERLADDFVRAALCERQDGDACGVCTFCRKFDSGNSEDVIAVGAEGSVKDKDIELLISAAMKKSYTGRPVFLVVRGAGRMTARAQNRLLKTLEEPPSGVKILLLTENAELLTETVRSRCISFRLKDGGVSAGGRDPAPETTPGEDSGKAELSREEKKRAAELARDIIYGKPFYAVNSEIGYFASSREKAEQFAEAAELFYRDIFVSHYDREGRLLINAEQRDIIRGCARDFTAEQMTSAASCAETAQRDLSYHVSPAHALKYMAFDIQKKIKE